MEKTKASMDLQTVEYNNVKNDAVGLENEQQQFEYAIQEWKEEQEAKAAMSFFGAMLNIFVSFATAEFDPEAILGALGHRVAHRTSRSTWCSCGGALCCGCSWRCA